jgi:hypothetical protein
MFSNGWKCLENNIVMNNNSLHKFIIIYCEIFEVIRIKIFFMLDYKSKNWKYSPWIINWHAPKLFKRPKSGSHSETMEKKNQNMFLNLQHFWGKRGTCWSFRMGVERTHKQEFKMKSTCTTKEKGRLVQVKHKWCGGLSRNNLKNKFYKAYNLWEKAPLPSL